MSLSIKSALAYGMLTLSMVAPALCNAELYVCRGSFHDLSYLSQYFFRDPSLGRPNGCYQVPDEFVQYTLDTVTTQNDLFYIDVNSIDGFFGYAYEKDAASKALVDAARAEDAAPAQAFRAELENSPYCNITSLGGVDAFIDSVQGVGDAQVRNDKGILRCVISLLRLRGAVD